MGKAFRLERGTTESTEKKSVRISVCERIEIHGHALMINRSWKCKASWALAACQ